MLAKKIPLDRNQSGTLARAHPKTLKKYSVLSARGLLRFLLRGYDDKPKALVRLTPFRFVFPTWLG